MSLNKWRLAMIQWNSFFYGTGFDNIDKGRAELFSSILQLDNKIRSNDTIDDLNNSLKRLKLMLKLQMYSEEARLQDNGLNLHSLIKNSSNLLMNKLKAVTHKILRCGNVSLIESEFYSEFFMDFTKYARDTSRLISMTPCNGSLK